MNRINKIGLLSLPLCFLLAGTGMLLLLRIDLASGPFFQKLNANKDVWINAHIILLASTICLFPAALSLYSKIEEHRGKGISGYFLIIIAPCSILLSGQYAIDFIMPLLAEVGAEAQKVHSLMYQNELIVTLFYNLPNLVFIAFMILSIVYVVNSDLDKKIKIILPLNWLAVLLGNLIDPAFQRAAILLLGVSYIPVAKFHWKET